VLSPDNGFTLDRMVALEDSLGVSSVLGAPYAFQIAGPWYEVRDPAQVRERVTLVNCRSTVAMVLARRVSRQPVLEKPPQQSDYVPLWQQGAPACAPAGTARGQRLVAWLRSRLSESVCKQVIPKLAILADPFRVWRDRRRNSFANRRKYGRV
jgi:hypothetical protein